MSNSNPPLVNKVAASGLITLKLEEFWPNVELAELDIKDYLFKELLLKEKDFREAMNHHDWTQYEGKVLLVYCSTDAIIPMWAYMLIASHAAPHAQDVFQGRPEDYYRTFFTQKLHALDLEKYQDQRVILKGCTDGKAIPPQAYLELTKRLRPVAKSIMFGEPCSTVPIFKRPRNK
ncbi:DUF2480 family protein [Phaeodactylibacter xiamenensis]|jgi:hypothetical protein|uniref:DUF2480 family protein n=1 Tax=Phaeodactylibacter xiamenensis TaxID=1524460 RepID=UPI0024A93907|nr:DUF2480 family protein [Phaeodactylibacter xiamenensis]